MTLLSAARVSICIVCVMLLAGIAGCTPKIDRARADGIAFDRLQRYAKDEGLRVEKFAQPTVRDQDGKWLYVYNYADDPKQSLAIIVFADARVEVSRMLEDR